MIILSERYIYKHIGSIQFIRGFNSPQNHCNYLSLVKTIQFFKFIKKY